jgi:osmotically-inducible protein OsmY
VVRTGGLNNVETLGGFSITSLEEPNEPEDEPVHLQLNEDEIAHRVRYALATDAYTADLNIEVEVEDGVVYLHGTVGSLDDIEQAEQIAGSVPGVVEVEEDLEIV